MNEDEFTTEVYYDDDADVSVLDGKTVAVLGYGSQGHAHAQNLDDSGVDVVVGLREDSSSRAAVREDGLGVTTPVEAAARADIVSVLVPDTVQPDVYEAIREEMEPGDTLQFAHGFNIHYGQIEPPEDVDVTMVAPKGPGHTVRSEFERGGGVPCLMAVEQDASGQAGDLALAWAIGIGGAKAGVLRTTFQDECETDLFGEQTVLCGGISHLIKTAYEVLVEAGYPEELAYYEVCHELKLIIDLIVRGGLSYMRYSVSNTAEFGDYYTGPRVIDEGVKQRMKDALDRIQSGEFANTFRKDYQNGFEWFYAQREKDRNHPVEQVGIDLRRMMPWLNPIEL